VPLDPYSPQQIAAQRGLPNTVEMPGQGPGALDPITQQLAATHQRQAAERLQQIQMSELEREQAAADARARAEQAKAQLEQARAEVETQEIMEHIRAVREERQQRTSGGGGNDLMGMFLNKMMEDQAAARLEASQLREKMSEGLAQELAQFRSDIRRQLAGPDEKRAPASQLADQIGQLSELRQVLAEFLPQPAMLAAGKDLDLTIRQIEVTQDFQLRQEQMRMQQAQAQREWDERKEQRALEMQLRQQELYQKQERNERLAGMLDRVTPRLADALSGMSPGGSAAPPLGGGLAPPPDPQSVPDSGGSLQCVNCNTPIPVKLGDTELTCSGCGHVYKVGHDPSRP